MRIRFTTSIAGSNYSHKPGDVVDWPNPAEARRFVAAGYAVAEGVEPAKTSGKPPAKSDGAKPAKTSGKPPAKSDGAKPAKKGGKVERTDGESGTERATVNR